MPAPLGIRLSRVLAQRRKPAARAYDALIALRNLEDIPLFTCNPDDFLRSPAKFPSPHPTSTSSLPPHLVSRRAHRPSSTTAADICHGAPRDAPARARAARKQHAGAMTQTQLSRTGAGPRPGPRGLALGGDQGLRRRPGRARHRPRAPAGRDRRLPRAERRRQDHDHRHGARAVAAHDRRGQRARHGAAAGDRPRPGQRGDADRRPDQGPDRPGDRRVHREPVRRHASRSTRCSRTPASPASPTARSAKCSGGEQQRLRFAMALLSDPALLLLDEPTTGMDVEGRRTFWSAIRRDAEQGRTVLFATHYLEEADQYADRIVLISKGRIVADGTGSRDPGARRRPLRPRHARRTPTPTGSPRSAASTASRSAATPCSCTPRTATPSPATCSPRPTPATWRSPRKGLEDAFLSLTGTDARTMSS